MTAQRTANRCVWVGGWVGGGGGNVGAMLRFCHPRLCKLGLSEDQRGGGWSSYGISQQFQLSPGAAVTRGYYACLSSQDRFLPIANVTRIMKRSLPEVRGFLPQHRWKNPRLRTCPFLFLCATSHRMQRSPRTPRRRYRSACPSSLRSSPRRRATSASRRSARWIQPLFTFLFLCSPLQGSLTNPF